MDKLDDLDDQLADAEEELDDIKDKIFALDGRASGLRLRLRDKHSPEEQARLEDLLIRTEQQINDLRRQERFMEARADELGRDFREEQKLKPKKPKPKR